MNLSEFIAQSHAEKTGENLWKVFVDGKNKLGCINDCYGLTEFEAKESAFEFYNSLKEKINNG